MRFPILLNKVMRVLGVPIGATQERAYVEITSDQLHISFGWLFHESIPLSMIAEVQASTHPFWGGLGLRFIGGKNKAVTVAGSYQNMVAITLKEFLPIHLLVVFKSREIRISLEDPEGFIKALREATSSQNL